MTVFNDWPIKKCLGLSVSLLLAMLGLIGLAALGFDIPILRQVVGFLFLTFIPGILILRILRVHNVHIIESLLYSVGLSLAFVMATGVMANFALPPLGISKPIALLPLLLVITLAFLLLCLLAYIRDKDFRPSSRSDGRASESTWQSFRANPAPYMLAILLPLLAILGANLVNAYQNNTLLFILIFAIALIIGLAAFNKFIHPRVYPFMIFMMALALLYQTTFISDNLVGSDIHLEYYAGKVIVENGYWDATIPFTINSCLSIVMLAPIYSLFLNMDIIWLFKIVYPFLFALMPLALFRVFSLQIKPQYAFLAVAFFITMPMFTMDMVQLARQQISELFFVLVVLLMVDRKLTLVQRTTLVLIFGFGVVVSYYGLGTAYPIGYLAFGALVLIFIKSRPGRTLWQWLVGKHNPLPPDLAPPGAFNKRTLAIVATVSLIFMLVYYKIVASGAAMSGPQTASGIAYGTVYETASGRFWWLNPLTKEPLTQTALGLDFAWASIGGKVWRIFQYLVELCLIVGFFRLVFRPSSLGPKLKAEYISLTIVSAFILLGIFILPSMSYEMGTTRIWQITLLLMSPLFIFGGEAIASGIAKLAGIFRKGFASFRSGYDSKPLLRFPVLLIMIPYFIFNSGLVFELSKSQTTHFINMPYSIALSNYRLDLSTAFNRQDVTAANWLITTAKEDYTVYVDYHSNKLLYWQLGLFKSFKIHGFSNEIKEENTLSSGYIYLNTRNTERAMITIGTDYAARESISLADLPWLTQALGKSSKIYDNGGAHILLHQ